MDDIETQRLVDNIVDTVNNAYSALRGIRGIKGIFSVAPVVVNLVEQAGKIKGLSGVDKKDLAIEAILKLVKLPWWLPQPLAAMILSYAIESAVTVLKRQIKK